MKYSLNLSIAYPSPEAPEKLSALEEDLKKAADLFNVKFKGRKKLESLCVGQSLRVDLVTEFPVSNPTREVSAYSQILKRDFNWSKYSQVPNRLFNATIINDQPKKVDIIMDDVDASNVNGLFRSMTNDLINMADIDSLNTYILELKRVLQLAEAKKVLLEAEQNYE